MRSLGLQNLKYTFLNVVLAYHFVLCICSIGLIKATITLTVQPIDTFIHYGITYYQVLRYELVLVEQMGLNLVIGYAWYVMICNHHNAVRGKYISSIFTKRMSSTRTCNARNLTCYVFTAMKGEYCV